MNSGHVVLMLHQGYDAGYCAPPLRVTLDAGPGFGISGVDVGL
jgi:hypothetical protein